jgi:hypothetical protein
MYALVCTDLLYVLFAMTVSYSRNDKLLVLVSIEREALREGEVFVCCGLSYLGQNGYDKGSEFGHLMSEFNWVRRAEPIMLGLFAIMPDLVYLRWLIGPY